MLFSSTDVKQCFEWYHMPSNWSRKHTKDEIIPHFLSKLTEGTKYVEKHFKSELNVPYGESEREKIDLFYTGDIAEEDLDGLPIFVYIHGGNWQEGDRSYYHGIAKPYLNKRCIVAIFGYDLSSDVHKIPSIEQQCVKGFQFLINRYPKSRFILSGHSAGAYLVTSLMSFPDVVLRIKGIISISGIFQLDDFSLTSVASAIDKSDLPSQNLLLRNYNEITKIEIKLFVGNDESPIFHYQSMKMYEKLSRKSTYVSLEIVPDEDHFSIIEKMMDESSSITQFVFKLLE
ncbi:kynurenine formamidase-like [Clytia hemisphaerica]|uniref:kynurenine formamidase-like n=1 Tax=Clytia hemisphaerica TaxID=252671 RepID=UPI0034D64C6C